MSLSEEQRKEVDEIIEAHGVTRQLSSGQKWDVAVLMGSFLGAAIAVLGFGGYFVVEKAASISASAVAAKVVPEDVASSLMANEPFVRAIQEGALEVPSGAVLAFELDEGCPLGWTEFTLGRGRAIIGATPENGDPQGLTFRSIRERSGEESHTLTEAEIASHRHTINFDLSNMSYRDPTVPNESAGYPEESLRIHTGKPKNYRWTTSDVDWINAAGGSQPHNNMPPYIALYFCKKG